jgi:hypothetical protein
MAGALALPAVAADYKIMAPGRTGRRLGPDGALHAERVLQDEKISDSVQVTNVPGAGGTIGLAQFVNQTSGDPTPAHRRRLCHGRRDPDQQSPVTLESGHADRPPDRRI